MELAAVVHRPTAEYVYPRSRTGLVIRLFAARGDLDEAGLLYWERGETDPAKRREIPLRPKFRDRWRDCCEAEIETEPIAAYVRYCFRLRSGERELWYGPNGFRDTEPGPDEDFFEFLWPNPEDCFKAPDWSSGQVYYQLFPERFKNGDPSLTPEGADAWGSVPTRENFMGGDLRGIREKLPYISALGATCLYLTPVFEAPSNHKYDTVDYYRIDPHFGTEEDLRALISDAHALGIRVLLDGVFNHCGYYWPPFQDVVKNGEASKYRDWFFINAYPVTHETRTYDCVGHYKWMPKLNLANPELRRYFIEVGKHWLQAVGADGWRLDVADEVPAVFWEEFSREMKLAKPDCLLLGETWGDAWRLVSPGRLDSAMNYLFRDAARDWLALSKLGASGFADRANRLLSLYPYEVSLRMYDPLDSHDTPRFLTFCGGDIEKYRLAVALQMCFPGCPAVYYGDELGMEGENDPDCRRAMDWEAAEKEPELLGWFRELIAMRKGSPALRKGGFYNSVCDDGANVFGFCRTHEREDVLVVINAGERWYKGRARVPDGSGEWREAFSGETVTSVINPARDAYSAECPAELSLSIPARTVKIFKQERKRGQQ